MRYSGFEFDGRTVSKLGFGAMGFAGWFGPQDEGEAVRALHYALGSGVTFVDTARSYGESEAVVGRALRSWSGEAPIVATKVESLGSRRRWGMPVDVEQVFPRGQVRASAHRSLKELGVDRLDLLQMHLWWPTWGTEGYWADELRQLKAEGLVRHVGVSIPDHRSDLALGIVAGGLVESIQTIVNIFDPLALDALLPLCQERGVALIARCVLDEGGLTGAITADTTFPESDYRYGYFDDTVPRAGVPGEGRRTARTRAGVRAVAGGARAQVRHPAAGHHHRAHQHAPTRVRRGEHRRRRRARPARRGRRPAADPAPVHQELQQRHPLGLTR